MRAASRENQDLERRTVIDGPVPPRRTYHTAELFRGLREVAIIHCGQEYRLRITKTDKLILTK